MNRVFAAEVAMTTTMMSDPIVAMSAAQMEVDFAKCDCCGLTEECTLAYIERIRERYQGKWICGLCAEAVKDEIMRCQMLITAEEALARHLNFCGKFRSSPGPPPNPTVHLIAAMRQILRRSLDSPKSMPTSPTKSGKEIKHAALSRSESCIPSLSLVDASSFPTAMEMEGACE